jgi:CRP-like cAMP-binding protein
MCNSIRYQEKRALTNNRTAYFQKVCKKRRPLLMEGEIGRYAYFVEKGALRSCITDKTGTERVEQLTPLKEVLQ